jgi:WD40 repeat protein
MQCADISLAEESASKCPRMFQAHKHEIACIALDQSSQRLATASAEGTLIRIFEINPKSEIKQLIELRRGMDTALLYSINFSRDGGYLCASSSKGTVHVYNLQDQHFNRQLKLATLGFNSSNLFEARYSMCTFQIPCELPCICAFGDNCNSVLCICVNGSYYKYMFTNDGKTCTRDSYENFLDLSLGSDF